MRNIGVLGVLSASVLAACATTGSVLDLGPSPDAAPAAPSMVALTGADVVGMKAEDLDAAFGEARLSRDEGVGEVKLYAFEDCSLLFFLYPNDAGEAIVQHVDATARRNGEESPGVDGCLASTPARKPAGASVSGGETS